MAMVSYTGPNSGGGGGGGGGRSLSDKDLERLIKRIEESTREKKISSIVTNTNSSANPVSLPKSPGDPPQVSQAVPKSTPATRKSAPSESHHNLIREVSRMQLVYSLAGLALGLSCVVAGVALFLSGVVGSSSWVASFIGAESRITDAAPGAVLFIIGLFVVWVTRYHVTIKE